jgi:hypothetical protein
MSWKNIAESVAILSVVLSLLVVGYELRQSRSIAIFDGAIAAEEARFNLRSLQIENIEVWQKGCRGGELSESEKGIFSKIVDTVDFRRFTGWRRANFGMVQRDPDDFAKEMALDRYNYPGFNTAWLEIVEYRQTWGPWEESIDFIYKSVITEPISSTTSISNCG